MMLAVCGELLRHHHGEFATTNIADLVWVGHSLVPTLGVQRTLCLKRNWVGGLNISEQKSDNLSTLH